MLQTDQQAGAMRNAMTRASGKLPEEFFAHFESTKYVVRTALTVNL